MQAEKLDELLLLIIIITNRNTNNKNNNSNSNAYDDDDANDLLRTIYSLIGPEIDVGERNARWRANSSPPCPQREDEDVV